MLSFGLHHLVDKPRYLSNCLNQLAEGRLLDQYLADMDHMKHIQFQFQSHRMNEKLLPHHHKKLHKGDKSSDGKKRRNYTVSINHH